MKKILALMLAVFMLAGMVSAIPVMAQEDAVVLTENFGKVKIQGKVQSNGSTAFAVRSAFGESETQDIVQYFVRNTSQEESNGMEKNPAFDFDPSQHLISKTSSTVFENITAYGGDERTPVQLNGFTWIGATHGTPCGVTVTSANHGVTYSSIGNVYKDPANIEWVLLRVANENKLVFISKNLKNNNDTQPTFYSEMGATLTNVDNAEDVITVDSYKSGQQLRPAYEMEKQNVYIVNGNEKTLVEADGSIHEGDYVLVEEKYTIMNTAYVAQAIIEGKPEGGYTENPSLAVGKPLVTFDLQQIYNSDGTVVHNWETTYHQDAQLSVWGGIQYGAKGNYLYLPHTKAFVSNSDVSGNKQDSVSFDFSNLFDTTEKYPTESITTDKWADTAYVPNRRLDFNKTSDVFDKAFAGGQLPVFDNVNSERVQNADKAFYMWSSRKAYFYSASAKINTRYPDLTGKTLKGSAYKKWIEDFDAEGTASYYSVPYFSDGDNSRYMYFDLYKPGVTKKYDISSYLGTYSISELEKTENLEYNINYETGILTVSSKNNSQTSADSLVLKAKYVGESVPAVEMKIRALPALYDVSLNDKLAEVAELMESIGADISDYDPALIEKYNSLLAQKEAYEQAIRDEAANADRVAGLNNRYEFIDLNLFQDVFATDADFTTTGWYEDKSYVVGKTGKTDNILAMKGFEASSSSKGYPGGKNSIAFRTDSLNEVANLKNGIFTTTNGVPFSIGAIETESGKIGANAYIPRAAYSTDYYTGTGTVNEMPANYTADTSFQVTKAQWPVNKNGISSINLLMTGLLTKSANRFYDVYVTYAGETTKEHYYAIAGKLDQTFEGSIKLLPKETYDSIKANSEYTESIPKVEELTVEQLNELRGYTPDPSVTVDTSKKIKPSNYNIADFNAATGFNLTKVPTSWTVNDEMKALYSSLIAKTKYQQVVNASPVTLDSLLANLDLEKITSAYTATNVALPNDSTKFAPTRKYTTSQTNHAATTYLTSTSIPVNPDKTVESISLEANMTDPATMILSSGGFYTSTDWCVLSGMLMLNYEGMPTVTIKGTEYVMYLTVQRECSDSMLLGMTLTREQTWLDRIATVEEKMLALSATSSTYADVQALRAEIASLLAQNTSIVYIKDFSPEARTNIDTVEAELKASADEEERKENLTKNVFTHVDMNKYGKDDIYVTDTDFSTTGSRQFGYGNTFTGILKGCTAVEKTDGDITYKEYYTKDNYLLAVLDVANDTYYYNGMGTTHDKDAYTFLGVNYQYKYVAGTTKLYYYKSAGVEKTDTGSQGALYAWYHDGVGAYYEKSTLAKNKTIVYNEGVISGDKFFALLSGIKDYTAKDKITGNDVTAKTGTLKAENGTEFTVGPFAPEKTAVTNGVLLDTNNVILPFGEDGVKADYINLLANIFRTDAVNTSYMTVKVDYENEDGLPGTKTFALILPKSGYSGSTNTSVQGVVDSSIFKVAKSKAQASYDNVFNNKETTTGISIDDIKFNTKVEGLMIYPSEMINIGKRYTQHSWYPNPFDNFAGVYKLPVSDLYKVLSVQISGNGGASGYANKETSDLYVEGAQVASNGRAAIPVEVKGGDENYNYYAIYSPTWATRGLLYAANAEKTPAQPKIDKIEELMQNAKTLHNIEEIEKLYNSLTSDGTVKESDFDKDIIATYKEFKENSDVAYKNFEVTKESSKINIKVKIANPTGLAGKSYTIITVFKDALGNQTYKKIDSFLTTTDKEIEKTISYDMADADAEVFIWKNLQTLKPISEY